ncbi:MAG: citrate/2-methylcitrate synthase [Thermoplasmata archaeon]
MDVELHRGLKGVYITNTELCYIDGQNGKLYYRGYPIEDLATKSNFEETSYLLLNGKLPTKKELDDFKKSLVKNREIPEEVTDTIKKIGKIAHPMDTLRSAVSMLSAYDKNITNTKPEENYRRAIELTAKIASIVAMTKRVRENKKIIEPDASLDHAANFMHMMGLNTDPLSVKTMDVALILHLEHGMNASTFSCVVTASTLADLYASITSGIATLKGPLHGGANEKALAMYRAIGKPENVETYIRESFDRKDRIMGFGHRVYKNYDPRAKILRKYMEDIGNRNGDKENLLKIALKVEDMMIKELGTTKGIWPNVDSFSGVVYNDLGIPIDMFTPIFAVGRIVGWSAHVMEYLKENELLRPLDNYIGKLDLKYVPIENR